MRTVLPNKTEREPISTPVKRSTQDPLSEARRAGNVRALASAVLAAEAGQARQRYYQDAVNFLATAQPSTSVEKMRTLPLALMEMFLVAEMENLNRPEVLLYFPKPGKDAREKWLGKPEEPKKKWLARKAKVTQGEEG